MSALARGNESVALPTSGCSAELSTSVGRLGAPLLCGMVGRPSASEYKSDPQASHHVGFCYSGLEFQALGTFVRIRTGWCHEHDTVISSVLWPANARKPRLSTSSAL